MTLGRHVRPCRRLPLAWLAATEWGRRGRAALVAWLREPDELSPGRLAWRNLRRWSLVVLWAVLILTFRWQFLVGVLVAAWLWEEAAARWERYDTRRRVERMAAEELIKIRAARGQGQPG